MDLILCPARILKGLVIIALLLAGLSAGGNFLEILTGHDQVFGLRPLFDMTRERSIPTWYSSVLMILSALSTAVIGLGHRVTGRDPQIYWFVVSLLFLLLSYDELFEVHESFAHYAVEWRDYGDVLRFSWVLPGLTFAAVVFLSAVGFLRRLEREIRHLMLLSGGVFVAAAAGLELLEEFRGLAIDGPRRLDPLFVLIATAQEFLELVGLSLFLYALLRHIELAFERVSVRVVRAVGAERAGERRLSEVAARSSQNTLPSKG